MTEYRSMWKYLYRTPHRLDWIDVKGVSTRYIEMGDPSAPPVVLIHGTAGSLENFCANFHEYARHFHVYALDMLGCGWTDKPDFPYTVADYARHVRDFMDAVGLKSASMVGVSLGSWVAVRLAVDFPGSAERIISIAPAGIFPDRKTADEYMAGTQQRRRNAAGEPTWESIHTIFKALLLHEENIIDDLIAVRLDIYQNPALRANMPNLLHYMSYEFELSEEQWRTFPHPILAVAAVDKDDMFLPAAYKIAELAPQGAVIEVPGCDHWAQYEQPELFNDFSVKFLKGEPIPARVELATAE